MFFFVFSATRCQLPVIFLFAIILSASFVCSEAADQNSEERNCQFNLIGIAALSCQYHEDPSELPSIPCCKSLLHAVDEIPPVGDSGECCLCLYTKYRLRTPALAISYISCYGKDRANVAKWTYPVETCEGNWFYFLFLFPVSVQKYNALRNDSDPKTTDILTLFYSQRVTRRISCLV